MLTRATENAVAGHKQPARL